MPTEKELERDRIRAKVKALAAETKRVTWGLLHKELTAAWSEAEKGGPGAKSDLAARCGVNPSQIPKWLDGQGFARMEVETILYVQIGLDISLPKLLLAVRPGRARVFSAFAKMTIDDMDKIATLNDQQLEALKDIVMAYVNSVVPPAKKGAKKKKHNPLILHTNQPAPPFFSKNFAT